MPHCQTSFLSNIAQIVMGVRELRYVVSTNLREVAEDAVVTLTKDEAQKLSSGKRTTAALRAIQRKRGRGYYSSMRPALARDYIINVQTGRFRSAWDVRTSTTTHHDGFTVRAQVSNPTQVGSWNLLQLFSDGTERMRERPILAKLVERLGKRLERMGDALLRRALRNAGRRR